jgi:hypothetical protein
LADEAEGKPAGHEGGSGEEFLDAKQVMVEAGDIWDLDNTCYAADHIRALYVAGVGFVFNSGMMIATTLIGITANSSMMFVIASQHLLDALGDLVPPEPSLTIAL